MRLPSAPHPILVLALLLLGACTSDTTRAPEPATMDSPMAESAPHPPLRVATYNVSFYTDQAGGLPARLSAADPKASAVAAVIQRVRPDILLLNEFDYEPDGASVTQFLRDYLGRPQSGGTPIEYAYRYQAPVNTGVPSGLDLDEDGRSDGPADAWGFGHYPGQYGMLVLSRYPIDRAAVRSFQHLRWARMPDALQPRYPDRELLFYAPEVWSQLRLSSKSHWDVPIDTPNGRLHFLVMHPTPPVFDGPEDRNGRRNHDEIRLFADYLSPERAHWLEDDAGRKGGLDPAARFVIAGDLNADPLDGDSWPGAMAQLLEHPRINAGFVPMAQGGRDAALARVAEMRVLKGDPAAHTGSFGLRVDYVLPSREFQIVDGGVFWPGRSEPDAAIAEGSDHHLVWLDLVPR